MVDLITKIMTICSHWRGGDSPPGKEAALLSVACPLDRWNMLKSVIRTLRSDLGCLWKVLVTIQHWWAFERTPYRIYRECWLYLVGIQIVDVLSKVSIQEAFTSVYSFNTSLERYQDVGITFSLI